MKKKLLFAVTTFILLNFNAQAQNKDVQNIVLRFLDSVQTNSYMSLNVKWDSVRPDFIEQTKNINDINDLKPHFTSFIKILKDGHSSVLFLNKQEENTEESKFAFYKAIGTITDAEEGLPPKNFQYRILQNKYAYINIPSVLLENRKYVDTIGIQLKELDAKNPKAWIIDLTENNGGNIMSMIWHFPTLIDVNHGYSYFSLTKDEKVSTRFIETSPDDIKVAQLINLEYEKVLPISIKNNNVPIVILTSQITASSGELFAAYFKGQKNVKLVGQKTNGLTSNNSPIDIGGNITVNLTTSVLKDRNGKIYKIGEGIDPDIQLNIDYAKQEGKTDLTYQELSQAIKKNKQKYLDEAIKILGNDSFN